MAIISVFLFFILILLLFFCFKIYQLDKDLYKKKSFETKMKNQFYRTKFKIEYQKLFIKIGYYILLGSVTLILLFLSFYTWLTDRFRK